MNASRYPVWVWILVPFLVVLHQGPWFWSEARLVLGLPFNIFYHAVLSLLLAAIMLVIVLRGWPSYLDED